MSQKRLSMRSIREVLRLKHQFGRSHRVIGKYPGNPRSTSHAEATRCLASLGDLLSR